MQPNDHTHSEPGKRANKGPFISRIISKFINLRMGWRSEAERTPEAVRQRILFAVVFIGMTFSGVTAVPAVLLAIKQGLWLVLGLDIVVLLCGLSILIAKGITYKVRAWVACVLIYIVGVYVVLFFGFLSGGPIWLFSFAVVCGFLLGIKSAILALCINSVTLAVLAWLHASTTLGDHLPFFSTWLKALAAGGSFLFLNTLVALSCALLIQSEKKTASSLKNEKSRILDAKRRLEDEITSRKKAEERQHQLAQRLEFLQATAMEFVTVSGEASLYRLIGERIREILGDAYVIVNAYEPKTRAFCTMAVEGLGSRVERVLEILGRDPVGMVITLNDPVAEETLKTGKLAEGPAGLHELSFGAIPKPLDGVLERLLNIRRIQVIGFTREKELFGSAVILDRNASPDKDPGEKHRLVEAYVSQASVALMRNRLERRLKASEEQYKELVNDAPAGIYEIDLRSFTIANVNDVMCGYTGYAREELMALNPLALFAEGSIDHFIERGKRIYSGQGISESTEYQVRRKDGSTFWVRSHSKATYEDDKPVKNTMIFHDITDVKRLEGEKQRLESLLSEARTTEAIATLAGGIAHQFNNILSIVAAAVDMLEDAFEDRILRAKYIEMVRHSVKRMAALTNQLLAYARGGSYHARTISLSRFVAEMLPALLPKMPVFLQVEEDLHTDVALVRADPNQMKSVLSSILTNAAEAMEGQGRVRITCRNQMIHGRDVEKYPGLDPGPYVALDIEDDGKGMDEETRKKMFDPFFTTKFQGRGLAMPAVFGIVKNHGGWIGVESARGKGTLVHILLPVFKEEARE